MRSSEVSWLFGKEGGAARLNPAGWRSFAQLEEGTGLRRRAATREADTASGPAPSILQQYASALSGNDDEARTRAAGMWMQWEGCITGMGAALGASAAARPWASPIATSPSSAGPPKSSGEQPPRQPQPLWRWDPRSSLWLSGEDVLDTAQVEHAISIDAFEARVAAAIAMRRPPPPPPPPSPAPPQAVSLTAAPPLASAPIPEVVPDRWQRGGSPAAPQRTSPPQTGWVPAQAILTCHYSVHSVHYGGFTGGDGAVLSRVDRIQHIPCVAVQGGCDMICPPSTALDLHRAWPEMELRIVTGDGHSMYSPGLQAQALEATDAFRALASAAADSSPSSGTTREPASQPQHRTLSAGASAVGL